MRRAASRRQASLLSEDRRPRPGCGASARRTKHGALPRMAVGSQRSLVFPRFVDEARLNRKNFETALRLFAKEIGEASERAHIYVSCRVTDWQGADDRAIFLRNLPAWKRPQTKPATSPGDYSGLLAPIFDKEERPQRRAPDQTAEPRRAHSRPTRSALDGSVQRTRQGCFRQRYPSLHRGNQEAGLIYPHGKTWRPRRFSRLLEYAWRFWSLRQDA